MLQENKARRTFQKKERSLPPDTHVCVCVCVCGVCVRIRGKEMLVFRKICCALFFCNTRFGIHHFALLLTSFVLVSLLKVW